jgi:hypothetical protein
MVDAVIRVSPMIQNESKGESMTNGLSQKRCVPCEEGATVLKGEKLAELRDQLNRNWRVVNDHHLEREFRFANFTVRHWPLQTELATWLRGRGTIRPFGLPGAG